MRNLAYALAGRLIRLKNRLLKPTTFGVRAVVTNAAGEVLLVRHRLGTQWYLPGGGVERGEDLMQALLREMREEVGLVPAAPPRLLGTYTNRFEGKRDFVSVFLIDDFSMQFRPNIEIAEWGFFSANDLPPGASRGTRRRIDEAGGKSSIDYLW